ncbi:hypothetical protein Droror1_Dr00026323 [Drosera rotundifolia]
MDRLRTLNGLLNLIGLLNGYGLQVACCQHFYRSIFISDFSAIPIFLPKSDLEIANPSREIEAIAMDAAARRAVGGLFEGIYRVIMRRNSVYVTFVILGAFAGERAVDYGVHKLWEINNVGKRYKDIPVLGQRQSEE